MAFTVGQEYAGYEQAMNGDQVPKKFKSTRNDVSKMQKGLKSLELMSIHKKFSLLVR